MLCSEKALPISSRMAASDAFCFEASAGRPLDIFHFFFSFFRYSLNPPSGCRFCPLFWNSIGLHYFLYCTASSTQMGRNGGSALHVDLLFPHGVFEQAHRAASSPTWLAVTLLVSCLRSCLCSVRVQVCVLCMAGLQWKRRVHSQMLPVEEQRQSVDG